jgi:hypothetical protein
MTPSPIVASVAGRVPPAVSSPVREPLTTGEADRLAHAREGVGCPGAHRVASASSRGLVSSARPDAGGRRAAGRRGYGRRPVGLPPSSTWLFIPRSVPASQQPVSFGTSAPSRSWSLHRLPRVSSPRFASRPNPRENARVHPKLDTQLRILCGECLTGGPPPPDRQHQVPEGRFLRPCVVFARPRSEGRKAVQDQKTVSGSFPSRATRRDLEWVPGASYDQVGIRLGGRPRGGEARDAPAAGRPPRGEPAVAPSWPRAELATRRPGGTAGGLAPAGCRVARHPRVRALDHRAPALPQSDREGRLPCLRACTT